LIGLGLLVAMIAQAPVFVDRSEVRLRYQLNADSKGFSLVSSAAEANLTDAAEPNVPRGFGVGFDVHNPKESNPFNANGNIYGRPEREVSLHWDGVEIANRLSPAEIRAAKTREVRVKVERAIGGSLVSVWVGNTPVYDRYLIPLMQPTKSTWRSVGISGDARASFGREFKPVESDKASVFDSEVNDAGRHRFTKTAKLPQNIDKYARLIGTLKLGPTAKGIDPWDRVASLSVVDEFNRKFEVVRCITPYRKGWTWRADLTHLLPILRGDREFSWECETYGEGWAITFDLEYFEGRLNPKPFALLPLWQGTYEIGNFKPLPQAKLIETPSVRRATVHTTVTGHGMSPNSNNAAEFFKLWRKLSVDDKVFQSDLWKEDNYLNPCRPQGGTWKYDRAGWAPGSVVDPWMVDVTKALKSKSQFGYEIQPYVNKTPVEGNPARHIIESVLVLWR
jgi:hypothetical protein